MGNNSRGTDRTLEPTGEPRPTAASQNETVKNKSGRNILPPGKEELDGEICLREDLLEVTASEQVLS